MKYPIAVNVIIKNETEMAALEAFIKLKHGAILMQAREAINHLWVCEFPDSVDFRCDGCNAAREVLEKLDAIKRGNQKSKRV